MTVVAPAETRQSRGMKVGSLEVAGLRIGRALLGGALAFGLAVACSGDGNKAENSRHSENAAGAGGDDAAAGHGPTKQPQPSDGGGGAGEIVTPPGGAGVGAGGDAASAGAGGASESSEGGAAGAGGASTEPLDLSLLGCVEVAGDRPPSSGNVHAPRVADLQLDPQKAGQTLLGSLAFADDDQDPKELIAQVNGSDVHYVCPLSDAVIAAGEADFDQLKLNPQFPDGSRIIYFGVRDVAGNVSAYLVGNLTVGGSTAIDVCEAKEAVQLIGKIPSASTEFYTTTNGISQSYGLGQAQPGALTIVGSTTVHLSLGECTTLRLAADAAGTQPVGWDNCLVVEYRPGVGGDVTHAWSYCDASIYSVATGKLLPVPLAATVPGTSLNPPVPNGAPFGYPALAIDLMSQVPDVADEFDLTLHVLDYGSVGSTTDIWAISGTAAP